MCTVSFIRHEDGFSLTSNRDEESSRPTLKPGIYKENDLNIIYPKDEIAGGTWIATADNQVSVCLLNGAFTKHVRKLPYSRSRGQVLKERFQYKSNKSFCEKVDLENVEPFTLLMVDHASKIDFTELIWDGKQKHIQQVDTNLNHIWASSTLYNEEQRDLRRKWFAEFLASQSGFNFEDIISFHTESHTKEKSYDIVMEREGKLKTVSVSQINITENKKSFHYIDLVNDSKLEIDLGLLCKPV
jgi:hypothetical protein